ncbi:hypothetical protein N2152v2_001773 [Parachlorella kessleri]
MGVRLLDYVKPLQRVLPEVTKAGEGRRLPFSTRFQYTAVVLAIFLICSQIPLYGVKSIAGSDPLYWARVIMASSRGTVMELGIGPSITAGLVCQLLTGSKLIEVNTSLPEDRRLIKVLENVLMLVITIGQAVVYVYTGMYGDPAAVGVVNSVLIVFQLLFAGVLVMLLEDMMDKGWGVISASSLFIATNQCESIVWKAFSPFTLDAGRGKEFEGALVALFHLLLTRRDKTRALKEAFYRQELPNMMSLLSTVAVFCMVIYFQGFRVDLPIRSKRARRAASTYPIKLFYTANMPIMLQSALVSNLFFVSQLLYRRYGGNFLVRLLGVWQANDFSGQQSPVGGLAYYISPPGSLAAAATDPLHTLFYVAFVLGACALFSVTWIEVSGQSVSDVAQNLREQQYFLQGHRDTTASLKKELGRYIPTAAAFGGMCIGALTIVADFMGAIGTGTGILLAVTIIYQLFEMYEREKAQGFAGSM